MSKIEVKHTFDAEVKGDTRSYLRNFVRRNLDKEPEYLKVVCLPGAEARDIFDIYDPLGIPRENITGIEMNPRVLDSLERQELGINLYKGRDTDFFQTTTEKYDVISLDYFQGFNDSALNSLTTIFSRQLLNPVSILHTNFYGSRERQTVKEIYRIPENRTRIQLKSAVDHLSPSDESNEEFLADSPEIYSELLYAHSVLQKAINTSKPEDDLSKLRDSIPHIIAALGINGKRSRKEILTAMEFDFEKTTLLAIEIAQSIQGINEGFFENQDKTDPYLTLLFDAVPLFMNLKELKPYFLDDYKGFRYISDDKSPMINDIFFFDQHENWFYDEKLSSPLELSPIIAKRGFTPYVKRCLQHYLRVAGATGVALNKKISPRIDIGSSYKPPLKREEAYKLLDQGVSDEEIMKRFRVPPMRLAAFKAWRTMNNRKKEKPVEDTKTS